MKIGYARVSTDEQKTNAQIDALKAAGCDVIYQEHRSGGNRNRPQLQLMLSRLQEGDIVVVYKMDRIARSLRDLMDIVDCVHVAKAEFKSLTEIIDTTTPSGRFIFQIFGAFAEFERELIRERTRVGLYAAMRRGALVGRPAKITNEQIPEVVRQRAKGKTLSELSHQYGVDVSSVKRAMKRYEKLYPTT